MSEIVERHETASNGMLDPRREQVAFHLARGETLAKIAEVTGVGLRTISTWKNNADFTRRVEEIRAEVRQALMGRLLAVTTAAVNALHDLLGSSDEKTVLTAASTILRHASLDAARQTAGAGQSVVKCYIGINPDDV